MTQHHFRATRTVPETRPTMDKLAVCEGYRVATEAYEIAMKHGAGSLLDEALFDLVQREAMKAEGDTK